MGLVRRRIARKFAELVMAQAVKNGTDPREVRKLREWRKLYAKTADAPAWQDAHRWTPGDYPHLVALDVRDKLELEPNSCVLEIGSGSGQLMAQILTGQQWGIGLDQCEPLVKRGVDFGVAASRIRLAVADAAHLPIAGVTFDRVFSYSVFQCFPSRNYAARVLFEMIRACRPGGSILVGDIFGVMEKQRRRICRLGVPEFLVDGLLFPAAPFWRFRQSLLRDGDGLQRRTYSRSFFRRIAARLDCSIEFLAQNVPNREHSKARFDVRFRRR